jgi:hypothetical protein
MGWVDVLKVLVAPLLVAVVSLLGAWWKETAQRRSREQVRQRHVAYVKDEIGVIEAWVRTHASLDPSATPSAAIRERARRDLDVAYQRMTDLGPESRRPITLQTLVARLLLRHLPATPEVRRRRGHYYVTLALTILWAFVTFTMPGAWNSPSDAATTVMAYFLLAILPAWLTGRRVLSAAPTRSTEPPPKVRPAPPPRPAGRPV